VLNRPAENWRDSGFDDSLWQTGAGGFGGPGVLNAISRTPWETPGIWLRTTFENVAARSGDLKLTVYHDEDVEVYLNGVLALRRAGHVTEYQSFDLQAEAARTLRAGRNVLAVHCLQTAGAQFVDVGLGRQDVTVEAGKPHDLLLDGPPEN